MAAHLGRWSWTASALHGRLVPSFWQPELTLGLTAPAWWQRPTFLGIMQQMALPLLPAFGEFSEPGQNGLGMADASYNERATEVLSHWRDFLRPREFSVRLDVKMKRGAAPYPRNPYKKRPVPKVKGIIRKLIK